jgi:hypothetical protein
MLRLLPLTLLLAAGCADDKDAPGGDTDAGVTGDDTGAPGDDTGGGGDGAGDSGGAQHTGDTGDTADPVYEEAQVEGISARVDEDFGTLVYVSWEQRAAARVWVEYSFDEGEWHTTPPVEVGAGPVEQLLLGVPYGYEVTFRVVNDFGTSGPFSTGEHTAQADPLPDGAPSPQATAGDETLWDPELSYLLLSMDGDGTRDFFAFIIDRRGRLVWSYELPNGTVSLHPRLSHDGTQLLIDYNTYWAVFDGGAGSQVARMQIDGTLVDLYDTPGLHHPFTELADGTIAWAANDDNNEKLMTLAPDGTLREVWDCDTDFVAVEGLREYCGSNTLWWDEVSDRFLYSMYSMETVIEIDHATGQTLRWFGHAAGGWFFSDPVDAFWWQHGAYITDAGTLLVSSKGVNARSETVVREYALDEESEALTLVWSFGDGEGIYGDVMGEAHRLPGGNTLHNMGSATRVREYTPDGQVAWDVDWAADTMGRSTPIADLYALLP